MSASSPTEGYPDTKVVEIRGKKFLIRRFTDEDDEKLSAVANDAVAYRRTQVSLGVVEPKLTVEDVKALDREIVLGLSVGIQEFNALNRDFLLRLKNLRSQVSPLLEMREQSTMPREQSPSTTSS